MKFTFLIFAIVCFWSARVNCDNTDIYSGIQDEGPFSKQDDDYSPLFPEASLSLPRMRGSFPWTRDRKPTKTSNDRVAQSIIREVEEMLAERRKQVKVKNFQYLAPHQQILDDPRPYAVDEPEGDFSFTADDVILDNSDANENYGQPPDRPHYFNRYPYLDIKPWEMPQVPDVDKNLYIDDDDDEEEAVEEKSQEIHGASHGTHSESKDISKPLDAMPAGTGVFKNIEFAKDPADFAYLPTDPRYMEESVQVEDNKLNKDLQLPLKTAYDSPPMYTNLEENKLNKGNLQKGHNDDDYGFLTDDDEQPEDGKTSEDEMNINVMNRNDYRFGKHAKDFLRQDDEVKVVAVSPEHVQSETTAIYILAIVAGVSAAAVVTLVMLTITWINLQKHVKNASDTEYPAYGVTGPNKDVSPSGDRRLAQSAQMYHYQHQKQQIIALERAAANERHGSISEADSDEENEEGDYTVYECPGLAPTGEMEVKNPMFQDDPTPAQTPQQKQNEANEQKK